ncbi:MAG: hypothetical protein RLZZ15_1426, partial [Verrucomicrobiota bacterium]
VGGGEQMLIGGFVIAGGGPKTMLFRAAGPSLRAFGVGNALAAPVLDLFAGPTLLQSNAGWSAQPNAGAVAGAAAQAGAFAFANGSADAALLVALPPGAYTAVVRGAGGTTGAALVEAYEVGAGASRLAILATRGFADRAGREMLAGFVVSGAPGTTKRVLVRVLGPSLARYKITLPMNDPFLELYNAAGELMLIEDDWSSGADSVDGVRDDFLPVVKIYNERQIAATGLAPPNRREPCVLMDLPPGTYTVVVKPFELLPEQPAEPGVALVEVYEITP